MSYIPLKDLASHLRLKEGDRVYVTSDVKQLLYDLIQNGDETDLQILIDSMIRIIGPEGPTIITRRPGKRDLWENWL